MKKLLYRIQKTVNMIYYGADQSGDREKQRQLIQAVNELIQETISEINDVE